MSARGLRRGLCREVKGGSTCRREGLEEEFKGS